LRVVGPNRDRAVYGKATTPECVQNLDALVAQKAFVFEQAYDLVAEELLGRGGVDVRDGSPLSFVIPNPSRS
jgi:hypothetical protein